MPGRAGGWRRGRAAVTGGGEGSCHPQAGRGSGRELVKQARPLPPRLALQCGEGEGPVCRGRRRRGGEEPGCSRRIIIKYNLAIIIIIIGGGGAPFSHPQCPGRSSTVSGGGGEGQRRVPERDGKRGRWARQRGVSGPALCGRGDQGPRLRGEPELLRHNPPAP